MREDITNITNRIQRIGKLTNEIQDSVNSLKGRQNLLNEQIEELNQKIVLDTENIEIYEQEIEILKIVQIAAQNIIKEAFETPGSHGLEYVFGTNHELALEFKSKGNTQEMQPYIKTESLKDPIPAADGESGGKVDIANLILRSMILEVIQPKMNCPLILDEPFKHLSDGNFLKRAEDYIITLQSQTGRQMVISSHHSEFHDNKYHIINV